MLTVSEEAKRLHVAMEDSPVAFAYFDAADRLQMWNRAYVDLNIHTRDLLEQGVCFADLLAAMIVRGQIQIPRGRNAEWIEERLRARRHGCTAFRELSDGRTFLAQERRDVLGGTLGFWLNVTDLVAAEVFKPSHVLCELVSRSSGDPGLEDKVRSKLLGILGNLEFLEATTGSRTSLAVIADASASARDLRDMLHAGVPPEPALTDDGWAASARCGTTAS
ncbi:MAG: PAS-domain containing protein [Pseudomonadota bacterium]